jgi:hypothetical protein
MKNTRIVVPSEVREGAKRGWRMFPVQQKGKIPLISDWVHKASADYSVLESWGRECAGCNWGVATGAQSGLVVVDVDGPEGQAAAKELETRGFMFPKTLEVVTGRADGGVHRYYRSPRRVEIRNDQNGKIGLHIDVRGDGGFVVFPPSVHQTGRTYRFVDPNAPIVEMPQWMIQRLSECRVSETVSNSPDAKIGKGSRSNVLFSIAGAMRRRGESTEAITQALLATNSTFNPPLPEEKVLLTAKGIERYPAGAIPISETTIRKRANVVCLADVERRPVKWLWEPYIPLGMVSMISGDPGAGKSFVALALSADVTRGRIGRAPQAEPGGVLYMTFENPLAQCLAPRFDSLRGDDKRFWAVTGTIYEDKNGTVESGIITFADLDLLDEEIKENGIRLVVVDPLTSFFGEGKNANHSTDTRPVFDRLAKLAEKHECAVLVIRHNNKQTGGKAIYRGGGSIDMTGAVRSEMLAAVSPENPEQRALAHIKANVGPIGPTQGFVIEADGESGVRFSWTGELTLSAEELNVAPENPETRTKQDEAREWLVNLLRGGSKEQKEIQGQAMAAGLKWATVRRAKETCDLIKSRKASMSGGWIWHLAEGAQFKPDSKSVSTFGDVSAFEDVYAPKMLNLTPLDNEGVQILNIRKRDEHLQKNADGARLII